MTRRAFIAAVFGAATARAVPKYFPLVLRRKPMSRWIVSSPQIAMLMDERPYILFGGGCRQSRSFSRNTFVPYCKNPSKYGRDLPPDPFVKLLEAGPPPTERITVMETWIRYQGRVYKLWNRVIVGDWPEDEAPFKFVQLIGTCANTYDL